MTDRQHPYIRSGYEPIAISLPPGEDCPSSRKNDGRAGSQGDRGPTVAVDADEPTLLPQQDKVDGEGSIFEIDPFAFLSFEAAPRAGHVFSDERDGELADDILANGVVEPVIVWNDGDADRLIAGNRRLAVVRHLRQLGHHIVLPARWADGDPATAIAIAHSSNTGRQRPSAMQQAKAVAWTIHHMGISQATVAALLRFDESKVSRLLVLAGLPDWVLERATDPTQLSELFAAKLQAPLQDPQTVQQMKKRAALLEQNNRTLPGARLARYLVTGSAEQEVEVVCDDDGRVLVRKIINPKGAITLKVPPIYQSEGFDTNAILEAVRVSLLEAITPLR